MAEPDAQNEKESSVLLKVFRPSGGSSLSVSGRILIRVLAGILVLALLLALIGVFLVRRSFPTTDGEISLPGLDAAVTVHRDESGVPTIEAETAHDLFLAQGFVHAQDRFWEMDFRRHVTSGRLSELFGKSQLGTDTFIRTLGWRKVAEEEVKKLDPTSLAYYQAYADGVNAYLKDKSPSQVSLEYTVLGLQTGGTTIEKWTPVDSVAWLKAMAWDLRSNLEDEIDRTVLSAELDEQQVDDLYPDYPYETRPTILGGIAGEKAAKNGSRRGKVPADSQDPAPDSADASADDEEARAGGTVTDAPDAADAGDPAAGSAAGSADADVPGAADDLLELRSTVASLPQMLGMNSDDIGSNSWVISGEHTKSGSPLLANDPHLAPAMPSVWYQVGLRCKKVTEECPFDVTGFSFSGLPGVVIGHNQSIAWGLTNLGADVTDLVVEKIRDGRVIRDDGDEPVRVRKETVKVAGEESREITIRSTSNGPLVSELDGSYRRALDAATGADTKNPKSGPDEEHYRLALDWTALRPGTTASAVFAINKATNWQEFRHAASLFDVPSQNLVYADVAGNIGYQAPGMIPRRGTADGTVPRRGWKSEEDWQGWIDFEDLPSLYNPERGWIVTANNPVAAPGETVDLGGDFDYGDRARRITKRIKDAVAEGRKLKPADMSAIQGDDLNPFASKLVPVATKVHSRGDEDILRAKEMLKKWNGSDAANSAAAAYFNVLSKTLLDQVIADKLPEGVSPSGGSRWYLVMSNLLEDPESSWWKSKGVDSQDEALRKAMKTAWTTTEDLLGSEPATWRWGILHRLTIRNASLGESGITPVEKLFNRGPYEVSGGSGVVHATGWDASVGYETNWVPSMRQMVDLSNFDASNWINLTGASGHAFHPHYDDQTNDWAANVNRPWPYSKQAVAAAAEDTLTLEP
ncbi:penicillin acylase family protein [Brevibacterium spongiae]|uniref:Penicillin acylase family protein n=1 Tax=Brevibacterium spongiae TaxID=2909672 RepID=A0ABY5SJ90_9MICO|nr:penicillin acylase family protein [Brevibacterium spongiae]UVI34588.1 penicillin acylase family protein [Brevibacterium spongiae]